MAKDYEGAAAAKHFGRPDISLRVDRQRQPSGESRKRRPANDGQRSDQRLITGAEDGDEEDRHDDVGDRDQEVDDTHRDLFEETADPSGDDTDQCADGNGQDHR